MFNPDIAKFCRNEQLALLNCASRTPSGIQQGEQILHGDTIKQYNN
jgi:hypothetical protein